MHSVDSEGGALGWEGGCTVTLGVLPSTKSMWSLSIGDDVWAAWWSHRAILFSVDVLLRTGIVSALGDCPGSVVYSLLLDHIPFPKANPPLSPGEAGPFLTRFVFSSLEGPLLPPITTSTHGVVWPGCCLVPEAPECPLCHTPRTREDFLSSSNLFFI